ncbi:MAG: hypothetical protein AB7O98_17790 [Hyphomonadaceae bacterium]
MSVFANVGAENKNTIAAAAAANEKWIVGTWRPQCWRLPQTAPSPSAASADWSQIANMSFYEAREIHVCLTEKRAPILTEMQEFIEA